jgi:hypothetical protein
MMLAKSRGCGAVNSFGASSPLSIVFDSREIGTSVR